MANRKGTKRTNNDLQNTTQKTNDRATRILQKTRSKHRCFYLYFKTRYHRITFLRQVEIS